MRKTFDIKSLVRKNIEDMTAYSSARDEFMDVAEVYLDANENPIDNGLNRYPDPYQNELKLKISEMKSISSNNILLGNGSDEVLDLILRAFCEPEKDNVICTPPTYGMYKVLADINNIEVKSSILKKDFSIDKEDIINQIDENTKLIFLCSPNNPSGNLMSRKSVIDIVRKANCLVVVDEAYIDFSNEKSLINELNNWPNLIICQTLSKAWGLAGIRLGMCFASIDIIDILNKIKAPYNINVLTQRKALERLNDSKQFLVNLDRILKEKEKIKIVLDEIGFVEKIFPSDANFWLIKVDDANKRYKQLLERGIVVRNRSNQLRCDSCLRITVGTRDQNNKLVTALKQL